MTPSKAIDFRPLAAAKCNEVIAQDQGKFDAGQASLCISHGADGVQHVEQVNKRQSSQAFIVIACLFSILAMPFCGMAVMLWFGMTGEAMNVVAVACAVVPLLGLILLYRRWAKAEAEKTREFLSSRPGSLIGAEAERETFAVQVHLVDGSDQWPTRLDDFGLLVFDPQAKRFVIEGVRYRYIVHREGFQRIDIDRLWTGRRWQSLTRLVMRVGDVVLHLRLQFPELWVHNLIGRAPTREFLDRFYESLELPAPRQP